MSVSLKIRMRSEKKSLRKGFDAMYEATWKHMRFAVYTCEFRKCKRRLRNLIGPDDILARWRNFVPTKSFVRWSIILVSMTNVVTEVFDYLYYPGFHDQCCYWGVWLPILSWFPRPMLLLRCLITYIILVSTTNVVTEVIVWLPILSWFPWPMLLLRCLITYIILVSTTNVVTEVFDYLYYPGFHDQCCYWGVWLPILSWFPWPMLLLRCLITYIILVSMTNVAILLIYL